MRNRGLLNGSGAALGIALVALSLGQGTHAAGPDRPFRAYVPGIAHDEARAAPPATVTPTATAVGVATGSAASATIGAAGGSVSTPDGKIALTIPAGALASDTVISIQPLTNMAHGKIGAAYRFTPKGQTFLKPVTLTFTYTDQDLLGTAVEALGAAFQTADGYWQWAGDATVDTTAKTVSIGSSHLSDWSLVKGLQIHPAKKTVRVKGSVGLQVVLCFNPDAIPGTNGELVPLGYDCDLGELAILNPVSEWSVNGVPGGGGVFGTVSGSGTTATYTAPATEPIPNTVAVSARVDRGAKGKTLVVSNITIAEDSWTGTGSSVNGVIHTTANVTWTLESIDNKVAVYRPTGTVSIAIPPVVCTVTVDPSSHTINPSTDGQLIVDYNADPPTYYGSGGSFWPITLAEVCPGGGGVHEFYSRSGIFWRKRGTSWNRCCGGCKFWWNND